MQLIILKYTKNEEEKQDDIDNLPHGKKLLNELVMPWANTNRIVCEDSYFASVSDAE